MMRIAYVTADRGIPVLGGKGASVHVREISRALAGLGHEVHLLCARLGEGNPEPPVASLRLCESAASLESALDDLVGTGGIDVVLERYSLDCGPTRRASARAGIPLVLEVNAPLVLEAQRWRGLGDIDRHLATEAETFRNADAVIVVSSALGDYVRGRAPDVPVRRIPNGADVERIAAAEPAMLDIPAGSVVIGFTGSMKPWHGVLELLDSFEEISPRQPEATLVLAGSGPAEAHVRERVSGSATLRSSVKILGAVAHHDIPSILAAFDIGVAPYLPTADFYFSPLKIVEYLAAGLPVVFPQLGDLPELVGDAGFAYAPGIEGALTDALEQAITNRSATRRLSLLAQRQALRFSWSKTAAAVTDVLNSTRAGSTSAQPS